ncbi:hypothetical protein PILCRDRAFT_331883 [Piloderma croceum F 1598]|uniref:Uncharacterized protein n=1 Tax=Piloderma croceum (strain F 1598) TaxID=765440 RepID=A0A0C3C8K0_PILCF|nr:hypothetical protein PILCRDRAFT_331883 [Piloderma croceum F 1598]
MATIQTPSGDLGYNSSLVHIGLFSFATSLLAPTQRTCVTDTHYWSGMIPIPHVLFMFYAFSISELSLTSYTHCYSKSQRQSVIVWSLGTTISMDDHVVWSSSDWKRNAVH